MARGAMVRDVLSGMRSRYDADSDRVKGARGNGKTGHSSRATA
jgi:hypothetical protein